MSIAPFWSQMKVGRQVLAQVPVSFNLIRMRYASILRVVAQCSHDTGTDCPREWFLYSSQSHLNKHYYCIFLLYRILLLFHRITIYLMKGNNIKLSKLVIYKHVMCVNNSQNIYTQHKLVVNRTLPCKIVMHVSIKWS